MAFPMSSAPRRFDSGSSTPCKPARRGFEMQRRCSKPQEDDAATTAPVGHTHAEQALGVLRRNGIERRPERLVRGVGGAVY